MLGYTEADLNQMIDAVYHAMETTSPEETILIEDLRKTGQFLEGLWAEGYFD